MIALRFVDRARVRLEYALELDYTDEQTNSRLMQTRDSHPVQSRLDMAQLQHQHEIIIERAQRLDAKGRTDAALDLLYDAIDGMMQKGEFLELDSIIGGLAVSECSLDVLLGVLTATLPARTKLPSRARFLRDVEAILKQRGEYEDGLLTGLDPRHLQNA